MLTKKKISNMNGSLLKRLLVCAALFVALGLSSQNVGVYKIGNLLKRIHNGSDTVYVVNFWATWCKPCVAELPEFEQFNAEQKNSKVKVLLVSMDFSEDLDTKVKPFLAKHNYTCETLLLDETNGNSFINQVSKDWSGAIPATLITTKNNRSVFLEKKLTKAMLAEAVENVSKP